MNQLDEFLKHKLANSQPERLAFREEYWEQALALLEADEAERRRRRWGFFWRFAGAGVLVLGAFWLWNLQRNEVPSQAFLVAEAKPEAMAVAQVSADVPSNAGQFSFSENKNNATPAAEMHTQGQNQTNTANTANTPARLNRFSKNVHSPIAQTTAPNHSKHDLTNTESTSYPPASNPTEAIPTEHSGTNTAGAEAPTLNPKNHWKQLKIAALDLLPAAQIGPLTAPEHRPKTDQIGCPMPRPYRGHPFHWGVALLGSGFADAPAGKSLGYGGGLTANYRLNRRWSFNLDALVRVRADLAGSNWPVRETRSRTYEFGFQTDRYQLAPSNTFWLEIPLSVQFNFSKKWAAEAGASAGIFLAERGQLEHFVETSFAPTPKLVSSESAWLDAMPALRKNYLGLFAGAKWQTPVPGLSLGLRANYLPQSLFSTADSPTNSNPNATRLWLDLGLRYLIF